MTSYTLSYWVKVDGEWTCVVKPIEVPNLEAAKAEAAEYLRGELNESVYNVKLEQEKESPTLSYAAKRKKNTQAWKPRQYGRHA